MNKKSFINLVVIGAISAYNCLSLMAIGDDKDNVATGNSIYNIQSTPLKSSSASDTNISKNKPSKKHRLSKLNKSASDEYKSIKKVLDFSDVNN